MPAGASPGFDKTGGGESTWEKHVLQLDVVKPAGVGGVGHATPENFEIQGSNAAL